jgi:hypothetical protein
METRPKPGRVLWDEDRDVTLLSCAFFVAVVVFVVAKMVAPAIVLVPASAEVTSDLLDFPPSSTHVSHRRSKTVPRVAVPAVAPGPCDSALSAAHDARAAANRVSTSDGSALYQLVVQLEDADQQLVKACLDNPEAKSLRYDAALEDADLLLREGVWLGFVHRLGGSSPTDTHGRDPETLRSLAIKQLEAVEKDESAPWTDQERAHAILGAIGEN